MDERFMVVVRIERNAFGDAGGSGYGVYSSSLYKKIYPASLTEKVPLKTLLGYQL